MIAQCEDRLQPIGQKAGNAELMACITQLAPHLSAADRAEWVRVAASTLSGIPADLMVRGAKAARETCKFPSEIVATIMADAKPSWERRKRALDEESAREANRHAPRLEQPEYLTAAEFREMMKGILPGNAA